jgi:hypothetical protein
MTDAIIQKLLFVKEHNGKKPASQTTMTNNAKMFLKLQKIADKDNFYYDFYISKKTIRRLFCKHTNKLYYHHITTIRI